MHIDRHLDAIRACRFCFMCRHLDPVGNVSFREADTPRGRALIADRFRMNPANLGNADFVETFYRSALSGANRFHCVSHYDELGLVLAARRDIVEAGFAPARVQALAQTLEQAVFSVKGRGPLLYFGSCPSLYSDAATLTGGDPGAALAALGFADAAERVFARFRQTVADAACRTLVVAEPSAYAFLNGRLDGITVIHCAEHLLAATLKTVRGRKAVYLESDFLKNYCGHPPAPRELLRKAGYTLAPFGTNNEESYAVGEGAVVFDAINPELCAKLCARVYALAAGLDKTLFVTASQAVKDALTKYNPSFNVVTLEEAVS